MDVREKGGEVNIFLPGGCHDPKRCEAIMVYVGVVRRNTRGYGEDRLGEDGGGRRRTAFHKDVAQFRKLLCSAEDAEAFKNIA